MFFPVAKIAESLTSAHDLALVLLGLALALRLLRRSPRLRRALVIVAVVELWLFSTGVVANLLLYPLETRYSRPEPLTASPAAIVMLTGVTDHRRAAPGFDFTEAADRFTEAVRLARRYPQAWLVFSGGSSSLIDTSFREARALGELARQLGVPATQLVVEPESRNTRENALYSDRLLRERKVEGPVLLVTSALHLPRAVGCFEKVGRKVLPWPVDVQRTGWRGAAWLPKPGSMMKSNAALHEYLGWLVYRLAGYL